MKRTMTLEIILFMLFFSSYTITAFAEEFLLPQSATEYLEEDDVAGFSQQKLNYARNEIYARHGRKFTSGELMEYFK